MKKHTRTANTQQHARIAVLTGEQLAASRGAGEGGVIIVKNLTPGGIIIVQN